MGLIGSVLGYAIYAPIRRWIGGRQGVLMGAMIAAWFTVLLAAGLAPLNCRLLASRHDFLRILSWMTLVHAVIGIGEAIITGLVVRFILLTRPDLIAGRTVIPCPDQTRPTPLVPRLAAHGALTG